MTDLRLRLAYAVAGFVAWLAFGVLGLRRRVVRENLERSFPQWTAAQRRAARREFIRRQGEVAAEALLAPYMAAAELSERVSITNPAILPAPAAPRPVILVGAHHCNAEWMLLRASLDLGERLVALYKPQGNERADRWLRSLRTRFGARLVAAKSVLQELARMRNVGAIGLLADQVPRTSPEKHWTDFLGQRTAFYMGPELLGRALRAQVCFVQMRRLARGRYQVSFEPLNEPGEKLPHGEVTERYARALERLIREDPAGWWWTHRRWKELKRQ